ncbi:MAG: glycoside hydrolase family 3 N-terminal domain-containing protein [Bacteroidota bacterium]|nr:glycoside hydrolase family 3 N-terminal domain-containing protein [Bacteroidota bacterium]
MTIATSSSRLFTWLCFSLLGFSSQLISQPSLEQKIAQMVMVGFTGTTVLPESLKIDLSKRGLGGVLLFASNIINPLQAESLTTQLQANATSQLLISVDQEGGKVARLGAANGFSSTPSAYHLGTFVNREDSTRAAAAMMAGWLHQTGININFAPVADVNVNPLSPAIGQLERSYSKNPDTVSRHIGWFIEEFHAKKIVTTLKHFPGHGSAAVDSHLGFTNITSTWSSAELIPFKSAIDRGLSDLIMVGHLYNAQIDSQYPASLSYKTVQKLLRDSLHFSGVVISDELFMNAISKNYKFDDALELCVTSGTDILLFSTNIYNKQSLTAYVVNSISQKVRAGIISENIVDSAYNRIQRLKQHIITNATLASNQIPISTQLMQNYPNPFNPTTTVDYQISVRGNVTVAVYDILGRKIAALVNEEQSPGIHSVHFDGSKLSSGVYFYTLQTANYVAAKKMIIIK